MNEQQQNTIVKACQKQVPKGYIVSGLPNSDEIGALIRMTAQGIDSHLQAIHFTEDLEYAKAFLGRRQFKFDPKSMGVLCRRLAKSALTDSDDEGQRDNDETLLRDILDSLGIDPDDAY